MTRWWSWWRRDDPTPAPARPQERWARPIGFTVDVPQEWRAAGGPSGGAVRVSREEALTVPAVKRARDLIAGTLGTLPPKLLAVDRAPLPSPLLSQPESDIARSVTMALTVEDMVFEGRAWWRITEFGEDGYPEKVVRLDPRSVTVREEGRVYTSGGGGGAQGTAWRFVPDDELIRIDSPNPALLVVGARAIRSCLALERTAARYAEDPMPLGYFRPSGDLEPGDATEIEEMLDDWEDARARRTWGYVSGALTAEALTWNPEQMQLGSARDYAVLEIARLAGVDPEELAVSTTSRTYANAEQRRLDLIDFTLLAYITAIEDRLSMPDVVWPGRKVWFSPDGFLRSDTLTRMQVYKLGREVGVYDDARIAEIER
ncbi:MAG: phage portal protein, partial [Pseudonocardia sp.]|nr:phage portal protein [Pseudonocardia sp.]